MTPIENYNEIHNEFFAICQTLAHFAISGVKPPEDWISEYKELEKKDYDAWQAVHADYWKNQAQPQHV